MYKYLWVLVSILTQKTTSFLIYDGINVKNRNLLWETWLNPFQTVANHTIYLNNDTFITYEQSTIIDILFLGTLQLVKLPSGSYILRPIVNNTKFGIIGLIFSFAECKSFGLANDSKKCFFALKRVDPTQCINESSDESNVVPSKSCVNVIGAGNIEDIFSDDKYIVLGKILAEIPLQRLGVSAETKSLFFVSRNFDESLISKYQHNFRDFFNYDIHNYSLVTNEIIDTFSSAFAEKFHYLSVPLWIVADLVPKCLSLVHYDDKGFLVLSILEYRSFRHRTTVTLGSIQSGCIAEFYKTTNTPRVVVIGDTPPYEKIVIVNGIVGDIQLHELYSNN